MFSILSSALKNFFPAASSAVVNYELSLASDLFFCLEEDTFEVLKEGGKNFYLSRAEKDLKSAYDLFNRQLDFYDKLMKD